MRYQPKARRRLSMTSLIDVIFLLLLFFMLSSTFSRFGEVKLELGGSGTVAPAQQLPMILLRISADGLALNGKPVELQDTPDALGQLRDGKPAHLVVSVAEDATAEGLVQILHQTRSVTDLKVSVVR